MRFSSSFFSRISLVMIFFGVTLISFSFNEEKANADELPSESTLLECTPPELTDTVTPNFISVQSGRWGDSNTWGGGGVPGADDIVEVRNVIQIEGHPTVEGLRVIDGGKIWVNDPRLTLTIPGSVTVEAGGQITDLEIRATGTGVVINNGRLDKLALYGNASYVVGGANAVGAFSVSGDATLGGCHDFSQLGISGSLTIPEGSAGALSLLLSDSTGMPIENARINLRKSNGAYVTNVKTDMQGIASFETVPDAVHILEVDYHGDTYQTGPITVAETEGQPIPVQTLPLSLLLTDSNGIPIENARVNLRKENNAFVTNAKTDETGTAAFEVLPNATHILEVDYHGGKYQTTMLTVSEESTATLQEVQTVTLSVSLADNGIPLADQRVDLLKENGAYVTNRKTDDTGTVSFEVLPGALHQLRSKFNDATWVSDTVTGSGTYLEFYSLEKNFSIDL
jgi:hypothetical protein